MTEAHPEDQGRRWRTSAPDRLLRLFPSSRVPGESGRRQAGRRQHTIVIRLDWSAAVRVIVEAAWRNR